MDHQQTESTDAMKALLSYIPILNVVFYISEKQDRFVRYHALQSLLLDVFYLFLTAILALLGAIFIPRGTYAGGITVPAYTFNWTIFSVVQWGISLLMLGLLAYCMIAAYKGKWLRLPAIGKLAQGGSLFQRKRIPPQPPLETPKKQIPEK